MVAGVLVFTDLYGYSQLATGKEKMSAKYIIYKLLKKRQKFEF